MTEFDWLWVGLSAVAAGAVNALAGGGTLITFPLLLAVGLPAVESNITNTVALCPGYLAGAFAQRQALSGQGRRLAWCVPAGLIGGIGGGLLLAHTGEQAFRAIVPYLLLLAAGLLAIQDVFKAWLWRRARHPEHPKSLAYWAAGLPVLLAAVYGGYFGAGVSVIVLAVLGLVLEDSLTRLNALKQAISFAVNLAAAAFFIATGMVNWPVALVMAAGALVGGALGGHLANRIRPWLLRWIVVGLGTATAVIYLIRPN